MKNTINSELIRGNINTIILKALYDGDRYGYDIIKEIEQKSSGQYVLKQPTLYSCLKRLEVQGFIRSYWGGKTGGGRRKYYTLTDMGRELFLRYQTEWVYSRTVIDKLISDEQYDLALEENGKTNHDIVSELPAGQDFDDNDNDGFSEQVYDEFEETSSDERIDELFYKSTANTAINDKDEPEDLERMQEFFKIASERAVENVGSEALAAEDTVVSQQEYVNTARIVDELYKRMQTDSDDDSYTEKLLGSDYEATPQKKPQNAFEPAYTEPLQYGDEIQAENNASGYDAPAPASPPPEQAVTQNAPPPVQDAALSTPLNENLPMQFDNYFPPASIFSKMTDDDRNLLERDYKQVLSQLVKNQSATINVPEAVAEKQGYFPAPAIPPNELAPTQSDTEINSISSTPAEAPSKYGGLSASFKDLGNNIYIREHSSVGAKEYNETAYYRPYRLMLLQYGILFGVMLVMIAFTFLLTNIGLNILYTRDIIFYSVSIAVAMVFPITAAILNFKNPEKTKRKQFNFKQELAYRLIIFLICLVVTYCVNIYLGMPLGFSKQYLCTLLLPALLGLCFPLSAVIFNALLASGKYSVK